MLDILVSLFMVLSICTMFTCFGYIALRGSSDEEIMEERRMRGYAPEAMCTCGHDGADHDWIAMDRSVCNGDQQTCACAVFEGVDVSEPTDWQAVEDQLKTEMGHALQVTWILERRLNADIDPLACSMESSLTIALDARVVESNPVITIVAGDRIFSVIENLPDGLFGEG
jgi:hypothetical protein